MCGIAGIHRRVDSPKGDLARMAKALLLGIEHRGTDATGVLCAFDDGDWWLRKETVAAKKFVRKGRNYARASRTALLHTRWATKGSPFAVRNAHPILDAEEKVAVVHNGVLWNDDEIFKAFEFERRAEVDSEAIPALINYGGWEAVGDALALIEGSMAIAAVHKDHPGDLVLARSESSPLHYVVTKELVVWASTASAIDAAFTAAGLKLPPKKAFEYLPEMHLVRVNGKVSDPERFAPDPEPYHYYRDYTTYNWDDQAWGQGDKQAKPKELTNPGKTWQNWTPLKRGNPRKSNADDYAADEVRAGKLITPTEDDYWLLTEREEIAVDVLIAEGYTPEDAIDTVLDKGWQVAGLTLDEVDLISSGDWEDLDNCGDMCLSDCGKCDIPCSTIRKVGREQGEGAILTIGDAAVAQRERKRKATAGLDSK